MEGDDDDLNLDQEKLLTKRRILDSTNFRKEQQFLTLCKAARSGDVDIVAMLARQGANLNQTDYDGYPHACTYTHTLTHTHQC